MDNVILPGTSSTTPGQLVLRAERALVIRIDYEKRGLRQNTREMEKL
jgi:hypothetical protein